MQHRALTLRLWQVETQESLLLVTNQVRYRLLIFILVSVYSKVLQHMDRRV